MRRTFPLAISAALLSACASGTFRISPQDQLLAEQEANAIDMGKTAADGLQGTWLTTNWHGGLCRWSKADPTIAICHTATRQSVQQSWRAADQRYRRDPDGVWHLLID